MHQAVKILTTIAALAMSGWLSYAHASFFGLSRTFKAEADRVSVDAPVAAPAAFQDIPRDLKAEVKPDPIEALTLNKPDVAETPILTKPDAVEAPIVKKPDIVEAPAVKKVALFSYPHELKANVDRINFTMPSLAPMAFIKFCMQYPRDCQVRRMAFRRDPIAVTKKRMDELTKINNDVNHSIMPRPNERGVLAERWLISPKAGDCNDYAVTKRHELLARGWPSRSLVLAEVEIPGGEHHLVLMVRTREDDYILDNLSAAVRPVSQVNYRWVRAQSASNPKFWSAINVSKAVHVAMNNR